MKPERKASAGRMRVQCWVSFDVPVGLTRDDCQKYILAAVRGWCSGLYPPDNETVDDGLPFDLDPNTVRVERCTGRTRRSNTKRVIE